MTESESVALPFGDSPLLERMSLYLKPTNSSSVIFKFFQKIIPTCFYFHILPFCDHFHATFHNCFPSSTGRPQLLFILHTHQKQTFRRRRHTGCFAILRRQNLLHLLRTPFSQSYLQKSSGQNPDHIVQKAVSGI